MTDDERWGVFEEYLRNTCECDFVFFWARGVARDLFEIPVTVQRRGLPKTGPRPMVRYKELLALLLALGLHYACMRGYAEVSGTNVRVLRRWYCSMRVLFRSWWYQEHLKDAFGAALIRASGNDVLINQLNEQLRFFPRGMF